MSLDDLKQDLEKNKNSGSPRADYFKLQNGDNKIVLLTNPIGYSELYNVGIVYEGCGYAPYASRRYKCYVKDLVDNKIKIANFSYTLAKKIVALSDGARTKFEGFPMPYVLNLKTENAGDKTVKTDPLGDEDYTLSAEDITEMQTYDPVQTIIDRLKEAQKKKVENDPVFQDKIKEVIAKKEEERQANKSKDSDIPSVQMGSNAVVDNDSIEYPEEEAGDIPF